MNKSKTLITLQSKLSAVGAKDLLREVFSRRLISGRIRVEPRFIVPGAAMHRGLFI